MIEKRKKSKVSESDLINRSRLIYLIDKLIAINRSKTQRNKALISFLYLTAARISEVVNAIRKYDIDFETFEGVDYMIINNVECLKRKKENAAKRNICIPLEKESDFMKYIEEYLKELKPEDYIFPITRQQAYNIVRTFNDVSFCHFFRHQRLTDMASKYGLNSAELRQYTGWSDDKPAARYVHLNWKDIARKMR